MVWAILLLLVSIVVLAWSADRFVHASVAMAHRWQWPPVVVGVILVGFGTSFPELIVSLMASTQGNTAVAVGNVVGSNIANVSLVLGIAVVAFPLAVDRSVWRRDMPYLLLLSVVVALLLIFLPFDRLTGVLLLLLLAISLTYALWRAKQQPVTVDEVVTEAKMRWHHALLWWLFGLLLLFISAEVLVRSAVYIAHQFGVSDLLIGLTVVTLGTSLPEVAATCVSARRGQHEVAVGHLVGSNLFNLLAVLAMPALVAPGPLPRALLRRDYPWMFVVTAVVWGLMVMCRRRPTLPRVLGVLLILIYGGYIATLAVMSSAA